MARLVCCPGMSPGRVEEGDGTNGQYEDPQELPPPAVALGVPERGNQGPQHQRQPQEQTCQEHRLPESAQVKVLVTLVSDPEVGLVAKDLVNGEGLARH